MDTVKELQHSLSRLIYSITDIGALSKIKSIVDRFIHPPSKEREAEDKLPWEMGTLSMKPITSFEEAVDIQGNRKITFEELLPYVDNEGSDYSVADLLLALS